MLQTHTTKISFVIVAKNAQQFLGDILDDFSRQDYDSNLIDAVFVDSNSTDETLTIFKEFAETAGCPCAVAENPEQILPAGWNVAIPLCKGDVIVRVDAHSRINPDFFSSIAKNIEEGEKIVGGQRISIFEEKTAWNSLLSHVEKSFFGSGVATYRRKSDKGYVKTMAHAAYSREAFDAVGQYDRRLVRTEDNDMHYRMASKGYKFCMCPDIVSYHYVRSTGRGMLKQKFANGYWNALTISIQPKCMSLYHFVPFGFLMGLLTTALFGVIFGFWWFLWAVSGLYGLVALYAMIQEMREEKNKKRLPSLIALPILFCIMHLSYGLGSLKGFVCLPFWYGKNKKPKDKIL